MINAGGAMTACASCGADLAAGYRFCPACGSAQEAPRCRRCSAELPAAALFCPACGTAATTAESGDEPLTTPATVSERRLTSVLFADLVGYTTLAEGRDTDDVRELLSDYFDVCKTVVRRYGGTIEKFIGDAVMAVWGVPLAHEDDAERAVRAGLELVDAVAELGVRLGVPELALRAGVVTGQVSTTVGARDQGMVAGDPVNTAARVQAAARPGQVWVDDATRLLTAAAVTFVDVGEHPLKGKAEPVRLFRAGAVVAAVGGQQRVDGLEAPLAGRDRELRLVKELFHATEESGRPGLVVLDGEAGIGKSRLAWEFFKYIDGLSSEVMWHQGRCLSYGDGIAYRALAEAVRARLGLLDETVPAADADRLGGTLLRYVPDAAEREWLRPRVASLLGAGGNFDRDDLFAAWTRLFERLAEGNDAVTLVIDDAQYADEGLLAFLEHLLVDGRAPVFVLLLARPELVAAHPSLGGRRSTVIRLSPLPDTAMAELVDGLVDGLPGEARSELVARADGVPLYAVETVRALIDQDLVLARDGRYAMAPDVRLNLSELAAPASLHALVAARLDALAPDERRVIADASVLGLSFTRDGITSLAGELPDLDATLESLRRKELIATETDRFSADRGQYRFVQTVVRQVAYATVSRRDRKRRHLQVAEHLTAQPDADELSVVIAAHLLDAVDAAGPADPDGPALSRRAVGLLGAAGARACELGAYGDGLRLFTTAVERADDPVARAGLQVRAAEAALEIGDYDTAIELARQALEAGDALGDPAAAGIAAALIGRVLVYRGELRAALEVVQPRYERLLELPATERAQLALLRPLGMCEAGLDRFGPGATRHARTELRLAERLGDWTHIARAMNQLAICESEAGYPRIGKALWHHMVAESTLRQDWHTLCLARSNLADAELSRDPALAVEHTAAALVIGREHGVHLAAESAAGNLALAYWVSGQWPQLTELLREFVEASDFHDPANLVLLMAVDLWRTDAGLAALLPQEDFAPSDDAASVGWQLQLTMLRAYERGESAAAVRAAEASMHPDVRDAATPSDLALLWPAAVRLALAAGDAPAAARLCDAIAALPPDRFSPLLSAAQLLLRASVAIATGGDPSRIEADLTAAIDAFTSYDSPPQRARAHEELGRWLLTQDRAEQARTHLDEARAIYARLGALRWLARLPQSDAVVTG